MSAQQILLKKKYGQHDDHSNASKLQAPTYHDTSSTPQTLSSTAYCPPALHSTPHGLRQLLNQYNASKLSIRTSSEYFPDSKKTQKSTSIPISAAILPFPLVYSPEEFPVSDYGKTNPIVRCDECRTYINPFTEFIDDGHRFKCNLCGNTNPVPKYYYRRLTADGQREDKHYKAELNSGIYDIRAGNDYMARPPMPPIYFFVIDVSQKAVENGSLEVIGNVLSEFVTNDYFYGGEKTKIGFLVFDTDVHLVSLNKKLKRPQVITLTDIENLVKLPVFDNLLVTLSESKDIVNTLAQTLSKMYANTKNTGSNLFNAVRVSASILRRTGGRMYIFQSSSNIFKEPSMAPAAPKDSKEAKTNDKLIFHPGNPKYTDLTPDMQQNFVSCNLFVFSDVYKNLVTFGELTKHLNGDIYYYSEPREFSHKFYYDFRNSLSREYTWESVFRVRVSSGWKITSKFGNFSIKSSGDLLSLPNIDGNKSLIYEFELDAEVAKSNCFYLQTALLYTTSQGERRIRVINYGVPLTGEVADIQMNIDSQTIVATLLRRNLDYMTKNSNIVEIRKEFLTGARQMYTELTRNKQMQEVLQEPLTIFSMAALGILKHSLLLDSTWQFNMEADRANALRIKLNMLHVDELMLHFVPYLFGVHTLAEEETSYYDESGAFIYPQLLNLSMASLSNSGVYLMDAGEALYMLVGSQTPAHILQSLFGIQSLAQVESLSEDLMYQNPEDPLTVKVSNLINELRNRKSDGYAVLHVFKEGERSGAELKFYGKLIEDKLNLPNSYNLSYADFLNVLSTPVIGNQAK